MKRLFIVAVTVLMITQVRAQQNNDDKTAQAMAMMQEMMNSMANAEARPLYKFPLAMNMHIVTYENDSKKEGMDVKFYINNKEDYMAFKGEGHKDMKAMTIIFDPGKSTLVMLNSAEKSYMAMNTEALEKMDMQKMMQEHGGDKMSDIDCNKTGKEKKIKGYTCHQYICTDKEKNTRSEVWMTDEIKVNIAKAVKKGPMATYFKNMKDMNGMMMEGRFYQDGKLQAAIDITDVDPKSDYKVKLDDYSKMNTFGQH